MIHEYIITAFKVIVGVITDNRLTLGALIALGVLLVWMFLSLVFSFQGKFASNVKRINEYVSRNGMYNNAKPGLELLVSKMPAEFQRGYKKFERTPNTMPSDHIKRFESLDMELSGGVFNQNKSVLKTFIHVIFVTLMVFSLAVLPIDESLTGYSLAEASVIPLLFFVVAKIMYYVYTAIRQYQYKTAVEEFNQMIDNMDRFVADFKNEEQKPTIVEEINSLTDEEYEAFSGKKENKIVEVIENSLVDTDYEEAKQTQEVEEIISDSTAEELYEEIQAEEALETEEIKEPESFVEEADNKEVLNIEETTPKGRKKKPNKIKFEVEELFEEEEMENVVKRGRGRPKKEVTNSGEFVITSDKEFEDALVRAEKLMRKNEEPLSASQTKRIEKQIKELVDAMTKYKEGK